ncbi:metallophosphoesterase family protein [Legionella spiritensis]|uniref:metallophosphoesterase family protein n=1 Tax=Legionella spiritensis TaxID=452 RepID=UPI000F705D51|nr:metallophosphoesterase family protein [Legionella spiritensis]VEG92095.1 putative Metallophosphoesterase [Legionella spiritensis]
MTKIKTTGPTVRRILLISDTHENLDVINQLVAQNNADMVIHAGDFGFYDEPSIYRLSPRDIIPQTSGTFGIICQHVAK